MKTSDSGLAAIAYFEGERLTAYQDSVGVWTIGIGHTSAAGPPHVYPGMTITHQQALDTLASDLPQYEAAVAKRLPGVPQHVADGAISFCFNLGPGNFAKASWPALYAAGRMAEAEASLMQWDQAGGRTLPGLARRRAEEADMIFRNRYPNGIASPAPQPLKGTDMANPLLDQLRAYADQIDDTLRSIDKEFDQIENLPFIGSVVAPFGRTVDTVLGIADGIRKTIDQLDPPPPKP